VVLSYLDRPAIRAVEWLASVIRPLESGDISLHPRYVFVMTLLTRHWLETAQDRFDKLLGVCHRQRMTATHGTGVHNHLPTRS
jgi:hypothetical protein